MWEWVAARWVYLCSPWRVQSDQSADIVRLEHRLQLLGRRVDVLEHRALRQMNPDPPPV
jgi:hypothetical protein